MKHWLTMLLLALLLTVPALALEASGTEDDLFTEVCGLWALQPDSPDSPLGDGVYFHVDGTCALYDASGWDGGDIRGMTFRTAGTWQVQGDTLRVEVDGVAHTLPADHLTWPEWAYNAGLRIDQSAYLPTETGYQQIPVESVIPAEILSHIRAFHDVDVIEDYEELPNVPGGPMAFALLWDGERRLLLGYQLQDGAWVNTLDTVDAIPQIDLPHVNLTVSRGGGSWEMNGSLWYSEEQRDVAYPQGPQVGVWTGDGEIIMERVEFVWENGGFRLMHYGHNPNCMIDVVEDQLVFYNISGPENWWARCTFDTRIGAVDFYDLPRRVTEIRFSGEDAPPIPESDEENALALQDVTLRKNKKYSVYLGPGKHYGRAANGKAAVSTNGWVQVFGQYDGWLLVQYAVSAEQYRFGWITADALAPGQEVAELPLVFGDWMNNELAVSLTDDPLNSQTELVTLPRWTNMERLAVLGDGYAFVRVTLNGKEWWGFVPAWLLGHG